MDKTIKTIKLPWQTKLFNKGQLLFVKYLSGSQSAMVRGKYRGSGRMITSWVKWNDDNSHLINIKEINISDDDYKNIKI